MDPKPGEKTTTTPLAVPVVTAAVARAAFPNGSPYLALRDELSVVFTDAHLLMPGRERRLLTARGARGRQRTDSRHVLSAVRALDWVGCVGATLRAALNALAVAAPTGCATTVIPRGCAGSVVVWRTPVEGFPPALCYVASPRDANVHFAKKRTTEWIGYKVHLTETCEDDAPHPITHVETTPAPVVDRGVVGHIHTAPHAEALLLSEHQIDAGYIDADQLLASERDYGVALVGPSPKDQQWQAEAGEGFAVGASAPCISARPATSGSRRCTCSTSSPPRRATSSDSAPDSMAHHSPVPASPARLMPPAAAARQVRQQYRQRRQQHHS